MIGRAFVAGAIAGTLVLGVGGRLVMRVLALLFSPDPPEFSWGGSLDVVGAGAMYGTAGGLLRLPLARWLPRSTVGPALGAIVYAGIALLSRAARRAAGSIPPTPRLVGLVLLLLVCVVYGMLLEAIARRPRVGHDA